MRHATLDLPTLPTPCSERDLNASVSSVGVRLAEAFRQFMEALPGRPQRPQELARALGVDKNVAHRLVTALKQKDPIATAYIIPGPQPLRRIVQAGVSRGLSPDVAGPAESAVSEFDALIRQEGGDRSGLDAIISAWLPDARPGIENVAKQLMYRGARQIKGISADVVFFTTLLHRAADPVRNDAVHLHGYLGLRRVRPGAGIKLGVQSRTDSATAVVHTLDGGAVQGMAGVFLEPFCAGPPVQLDVHEEGATVVYGLKWGDAVGYTSARDVVMGEWRPRAMRRFRREGDERRRAGVTDAINVPARTYIADLIMHKDVYPQWEPRVRVLETGEAGWADANDPTREFDVLDLAERVEPLGTDLEYFRAAEIPKYIDLLHYVCERRQWEPRDFRGYRTRIDYPVFGSQVQFVFEVPFGAPGGDGR